jgi:hypothetical protein
MITRPCILTGACCAIRAEVFDIPGMGYFDTDKVPHPTEDEVFCNRLRAAGRQIGYVPGLRATHWHRPPVDELFLRDAGWWQRQAAYAGHRAAEFEGQQAGAQQAGAQQAAPLHEVG